MISNPKGATMTNAAITPPGDKVTEPPVTQPATPLSMDITAATEKAKAKAAQMQNDDKLARAKGSSPEQLIARQHVAAFFREAHCPTDAPEVRAAHLAAIDYGAPVATINGRTVDLQSPRAKGLLGLGRKPAYWVSERFPPKSAEDPIYALEFFPVKR